MQLLYDLFLVIVHFVNEYQNSITEILMEAPIDDYNHFSQQILDYTEYITNYLRFIYDAKIQR